MDYMERLKQAGRSCCYICLKLDDSDNLDEWHSMCQDCALTYCPECFHTDDHVMCLREEDWKKTWAEVHSSLRQKRKAWRDGFDVADGQ